MRIQDFCNPIDISIEKSKQKAAANKDPFDLDLKVADIRFGSPVPINELITSKSLCTPGCGNTGTNNSFCC